MSRSHSFYVLTEITEFPDALLEALSKLIKRDKNLIRGEEVLKSDMIAISFFRDRPKGFYITTDKEAAMLNIKDKALFSAVKYYNNSENDFLCEIVLMVKYYLKENFVFFSDDFEHGVSFDWIAAAQKLTEKGYPIEFASGDNISGAIIIIDGIEIENTFDEDRVVFNSIFIEVEK